VISPYVRTLRERVGHMRVLMPSVSAHIFDEAGRMLLVQLRDSGAWTTPGGAIEPDERPVDAVIRETLEETGLTVVPERIVAAFGGPECVVRYANGDETQYVIIAYRCTVAGGSPRADNDETSDVRYIGEAEAAALPLSPWLRALLAEVYRTAAV
jgi:8-oxo-dGTP pyrophosphatase MutT (NUDIX family)